MNTLSTRGVTWDVVTRAAAMYGRVVSQSLHVESGYRNSSYSFVDQAGDRLNFILYKHEPDSVGRIKRANTIGSFLLHRGLPARAPVDPRILKVGNRYGSLYRYLPGTTIPWESYTMKHIKLLGMTMGDMHAALLSYREPLPTFVSEYEQITRRMSRYYARAGVVNAMDAKLHLGFNDNTSRSYASLFDELSLQPAQPIHMDFVRGNVLFGSDVSPTRYTLGTVTLSGLLDFEKACHGPVVCDIARTLAFLYVDCAAKDTAKIYKYAIDSGYIKRSRALLQNNGQIRERIDRLVTFFLEYDFYKFLRDNPYESLLQNHHFLRTRDMLIARKVLQYRD